MTLRTFVCQHCGDSFSRNVVPSRSNLLYCSPACRNKARARKDYIPCSICGTQYIPYKRGKRDDYQKFCSRECSIKALHGRAPTYVVHSDETRNQIREQYATSTIIELSEKLGITKSALTNLAHKMGLTKAAEFKGLSQYQIVSAYMREHNPMKSNTVRSKVKQYWVDHPDEWQEHLKKLNQGHQKIQRDKPSKLEIKLRRYLDELGVDYEPSALLKDKFIVDIRIGDLIIEADGDFWHGHPRFEPLSERQKAQQKRDASRNKYLTTCGYTVIRIWESDMPFDLVKSILEKRGLI